MAVTGAAALALVYAISDVASFAIGDSLTRNTIRLALAWYTASLLLMMQLRDSDDWRGATDRGRIVRWCWTWGAILFVVHVCMAFHFFHHWSQAHAIEHTRDVSGFGEGLYVSYAFTLLWVGDAIWWWWSPARYVARSGWFDRILHAFMLFIIFNGTVVFEAGPIRWIAMIAFILIGALWARRVSWPRELAA